MNFKNTPESKCTVRNTAFSRNRLGLLYLVLACLSIAVLSGCDSGPKSDLDNRGTPAAKYKDSVKAASDAGVMWKCDGTGEVTFLDFHAHPDIASAVTHVKQFPNVKLLNFSSCKLSDSDLANAADLVHIEELGLNGTDITDAGLVHLAKMTKLRQLNLTDTEVGDAGLASLTGFKELVRIDLQNTKVTDAGMQHLEQLPNLVWIQLSNCPISDGVLEQLRAKFPDAQVTCDVIEDTSNVPMLTDAELPDA